MNPGPGSFPSENSAELKNHPAWLRLEDQLHWYDTKSIINKRWYKGFRVTQLCLAAAIPVIALGRAKWSP